ncbi:glycine betaine/L-proline ABC transporter ATP-binding protein ProV [Fodinicurvata sp. EGI_FJ10296]|uniref:glycine betaine/L-proline ABC transporter ATP-binding protein ProV n=1 Tax=Fodinicurvata sp. EGI_FJ10296 TaxID=3231908 RepID=UPI003451AC30
MTDKLVVKNLYKIFGPHPDRARAMLEDGSSKDEIYAETGATVAVNNASFSVQKGEVFVIMGLSGSGKSTIVRLLNRLIEPTSGQVMVDDRDIAALSQKELIEIRRRLFGMVFQSFALMPHLTVVENAEFGLAVAGYGTADRRQRALEALEKVGLRANADAMPSELSGGMQQRVGLARALAVDPAIMLMDEAFSALDPLIRTEMQDELLRLQQEAERTVIFISHDLDEAMRIGDRIAIMQDGMIVQVGRPDEIVRNPANEYVQSFFKGVDVTQVFTAGHIAAKTGLTIVHRGDDGVDSALQRLRKHETDYAYVHDRSKKFKGVVSSESLRAQAGGSGSIDKALLPDIKPVSADTSLSDLMGLVADAPCPLPVVDSNNVFVGTISRAALLRTLDRNE